MSDVRTNAEIAAKRLREVILRGEIKPGEKLNQNQLADELGLSRTPLRSALSALAQTGLVIYESNRGFRVRKFSQADVAGTFEVRAELEATACRIAARHITEQDSKDLTALVDKGDALLSPGTLLPENHAPYREMNVSFHETVLRIADNPWITDFIDRLHNVPMASDRIILWNDYHVIRRSHDDHRRIATALTMRQGERAASIMREHITYALEHLLYHVDETSKELLRLPAAVPE